MSAGDQPGAAVTARGVAGSGEVPLAAVLYQWVFPGTTGQVRRVRRALAAVLDDCPVASDVIVCGSELAANAVRHSRSGRPGGSFTVRAEIRPGRDVLLEVEDQGGPWQPGPDLDGRMHGLGIVAAMATELTARGGITGRTTRARFTWPLRP